MTQKKLPELEFTQERIVPLVSRLVDEDTLIVTDFYGYPILREAGNAVLVRDCHHEQIARIKNTHQYSKVLAVGGCTALDMGRAVAVGKEVVTIPTILSTSCISVDRSIIKYEEGSRLEQTLAPSKTIVSIPSISETYFEELERWSQSGFGDLFANISASIDLQYKKGDVSYDSVKKNVPECFEALDWVIDSFQGYDQSCLTRLAQYLHNSSLIVITRGDTDLSAAGEHKLYHKMMGQQTKYSESKPTHGQLVAVGSLLSAKIFSEQTADDSLYENMRRAYKKLGLPLDYDQLQRAGIEKVHIVQGLESITDTNTHLGDYFKAKNYGLIDRVFGGENNG